jgi:hypothetical protein
MIQCVKLSERPHVFLEDYYTDAYWVMEPFWAVNPDYIQYRSIESFPSAYNQVTNWLGARPTLQKLVSPGYLAPLALQEAYELNLAFINTRGYINIVTISLHR